MTFRKQFILSICALMIGSTGFAAETTKSSSSEKNAKSAQSEMKENSKDASEQVTESAQILQKMEAEKNLKPILQQARGIFIIPTYGRAAAGVGLRAGEGIALMKQGSTWSDPAFYNFGGISAGLQAGAEGGSMAFILNNDKAVQRFMKNNNFSLNADAGLTIVDWSAKGQAELSKADIVAWSDTKGLFGGAAIHVKDIMFDDEDSAAFYGKKVSLNDIVTGKVKAPQQKVSKLKEALPGALSGGSLVEEAKKELESDK